MNATHEPADQLQPVVQSTGALMHSEYRALCHSFHHLANIRAALKRSRSTRARQAGLSTHIPLHTG
jgi:hypothetical protein